jgi:hypothetical protein
MTSRINIVAPPAADWAVRVEVLYVKSGAVSLAKAP